MQSSFTVSYWNEIQTLYTGIFTGWFSVLLIAHKVDAILYNVSITYAVSDARWNVKILLCNLCRLVLLNVSNVFMFLLHFIQLIFDWCIG